MYNKKFIICNSRISTTTVFPNKMEIKNFENKIKTKYNIRIKFNDIIVIPKELCTKNIERFGRLDIVCLVHNDDIKNITQPHILQPIEKTDPYQNLESFRKSFLL